MELLFETRSEIAGTEGKLYFVQCRPQLHPEPVLQPDTFVDGAGASIYGTVLQDGGRYRMWYQAWPKDWTGQDVDLVGYAESNDGIAWHKPALGLVDYGPGSNNLCDLGFHSPSVFIDPAAPAAYRYRATGYTAPGRTGAWSQVRERGYYSAHSPDGISWALDGDTPRWPSGDVITSVYHPVQGRGMTACKYSPRVGGFRRRSVWNAELVDGAWSAAIPALLPDEYDDICAIARGYASADYYGMGMMPAGRGTVGFLWRFFHALPRTSGSETGVFGAVDISLVYQAERGARWLHRPGREDFISHHALPWTSGGIYTASAAVESSDEQRLYFTGTIHSHGWYIDNRWQLIEPLKRQMIDEGFSRIGYASWPKDRLFGLRSDPQGMLELDLGYRDQPCQLLLNYQTERSGSVRVERPGWEGYGLDDCASLSGDSLSSAVAWRHGATISPTKGAPLRLRLHLDRATLFAYEVIST